MLGRKLTQQVLIFGLMFLVACSSPTTLSTPTIQRTAIPPMLTIQPTTIPPTPTLRPTDIPLTPTNEVLITIVQEIYGTWQPLATGPDAMYIQFNEDGTCRQSFSLAGLINTPEVECTYRFEESHLILTTVRVNGVPACSSPTGTYKVRSLPENKIKLVSIEDTCSPRKKSTRGEYIRVP